MDPHDLRWHGQNPEKLKDISAQVMKLPLIYHKKPSQFWKLLAWIIVFIIVVATFVAIGYFSYLHIKSHNEGFYSGGNIIRMIDHQIF